eukprot:3204509-Pyramimonas_sp.AAC.1
MGRGKESSFAYPFQLLNLLYTPIRDAHLLPAGAEAATGEALGDVPSTWATVTLLIHCATITCCFYLGYCYSTDTLRNCYLLLLLGILPQHAEHSVASVHLGSQQQVLPTHGTVRVRPQPSSSACVPSPQHAEHSVDCAHEGVQQHVSPSQLTCRWAGQCIRGSRGGLEGV